MSALPSPQEFSLIDVRDVWPGEAKDFTPWLADNLQALSEHLGISDLDLDATEVEVPGGRQLDILAKDTDGEYWAIENQYGEADHDHMTRALAYAIGLKCRAAVIVAESHRDEFVAVADEWNRYSESYGLDGIRLFLAAVEVGRIGDSVPGFRFRLVAGPNEWKSVTATGGGSLSEADQSRREERYEFWSGLQKVMKEQGTLFRPTAVGGYSWVSILSKGPFGFQFWVTQDSCRVQLYIDSSDGEENDELFDALEQRRKEVHQSLGTDLDWVNNPGSRSNRISWTPKEACGYRTPNQDRQAGYKALADAMYRFHNTFMPHIEELV